MRDYEKFLKEDNRLNVRLVPRPLYTRMVKEYRQDHDVIVEVFHELFWLYDLEEKEQSLSQSGAPVDRSRIAEQLLGEMDDNDWWKVMEAFETHFQTHFHECSERWSEELDPVYDRQEQAGWIDIH